VEKDLLKSASAMGYLDCRETGVRLSSPMGQPFNTLYYGDNLDILRRYVDDESVDLISSGA
jgi:hypothetical protein